MSRSSQALAPIWFVTTEVFKLLSWQTSIQPNFILKVWEDGDWGSIDHWDNNTSNHLTVCKQIINIELDRNIW